MDSPTSSNAYAFDVGLSVCLFSLADLVMVFVSFFPNPSPRQIKYNKFYNNCFSVKLGKKFSLFIHLFDQHFSEYWSANHSSRDWSSNSDQNMDMERILQCSHLWRKDSAVGHLLLIPPPRRYLVRCARIKEAAFCLTTNIPEMAGWLRWRGHQPSVFHSLVQNIRRNIHKKEIGVD